jgi:hypothetical protein
MTDDELASLFRPIVSTGPSWLSTEDTERLGLKPGAPLRVGRDLRWYHTDESLAAFRGPYETKAAAQRGVDAYIANDDGNWL